MRKVKYTVGSLAAFTVLVPAGAAFAHGAVTIRGTMKADTITGTPGPDFIVARRTAPRSSGQEPPCARRSLASRSLF